MEFLSRVPGPPLSQFINQIWYFNAAAPAHKFERVLPTGEMQVLFSLSGKHGLGAFLVGAQSHFGVIPADLGPMMGVHFRAGGAFPFFKLPAGELHNSALELHDLWGGRAMDLYDAIREARSVEAKLDILERALLELVVLPGERHSVVRFALREFASAPEIGTVSRITDQISLSRQRFIEVFRDQVGLTPKLYCRIRRFHRVVAQVHAMQRVEWAQVALDGGYYDQAHFIHDFRAFSGINPSEYLVNRTYAPSHVVLADEGGTNTAAAR